MIFNWCLHSRRSAKFVCVSLAVGSLGLRREARVPMEGGSHHSKLSHTRLKEETHLDSNYAVILSTTHSFTAACFYDSGKNLFWPPDPLLPLPLSSQQVSGRQKPAPVLCSLFMTLNYINLARLHTIAQVKRFPLYKIHHKNIHKQTYIGWHTLLSNKQQRQMNGLLK